MIDDGGRIGLARLVGDSRPLRAAIAGRPSNGLLQTVIKGAARGLARRRLKARRPEGATASGPTPSVPP